MGFVASTNLITKWTYLEGFVMILWATQNGPCFRCEVLLLCVPMLEEGELHLWNFHGMLWLMHWCCGCAKVQLVSRNLQLVGNKIMVCRGELCWLHKSSDKNLKSCTNLQKCPKSWIVAKKCFYTIFLVKFAFIMHMCHVWEAPEAHPNVYLKIAYCSPK